MKLYFNDGSIVDIKEISHAIVDSKKESPFFTITFENYDSNEIFVEKVKDFINKGYYINIFYKSGADAQAEYTVDQLVGFTI